MLEKIYEKHGIEEKVETNKKVLLVLPEKDHDYSRFLEWSLFDKSEVALTWPKSEDKKVAYDVMLYEAKYGSYKLYVQVDCSFSKKMHWFKKDDISPDLEDLVKEVRGNLFVNLHHHDEYSIRDGLGTVSDLAKLQKSRNNPFLPVTNHGSVGGWIKQYNVGQKTGLKPIYGMEAYVNDYRGDDPDERKLHRSNYHLVVLAKNRTGYDNIIRMHNDAQLNGFYYLPRCNYDCLRRFGEGVIATSACMSGEISSRLMQDDKDGALLAYRTYKDAFDEFYIELTMVDMEEQKEANERLIQFAKEVKAPLVVTCDSHYLMPEHSETHEILMCIKAGKTIEQARDSEKDEVWQFAVKSLFSRSEEQLYEVWESRFKSEIFTQEVLESAILNTRKIACKCEPIQLDSSYKLPKLYEDANGELRKRAYAGFKKRNLEGRPGYPRRLERELGIIINMGFADYFLVVEKIVADAYEKYGEWAVGYGRGSCAGSLVSYCLFITDIDPIKYNILFERFLDESRPDMPDIDLDFHPAIRDRVKETIVQEFGAEHTCSIATYQTYKTSSVIIDCARACGHDVWEAMSVTKQFSPLDSFEVGSGEDAHEVQIDNMEFKELFKHYPDLEKYMNEYPDVLQHAIVLRNQVKNLGKHAGGMIISNLNLDDCVPVYKDKHEQVVSTWSEGMATHELSAVGLVKFDILGLKNLAIIQDTIDYIEQSQGIRLKRSELDIDNKEAIKQGSKKDLMGVFQFENPATKPVADAVKMESIEDISAVTSLIRPGPRDQGMDVTYAERKHGRESYSVPKCVEFILKDTQGIAIYQDQCLTGDTIVKLKNGHKTLLEIIEDLENGKNVEVCCVDDELNVCFEECVQPQRKGKQEIYEVILENGLSIKCTAEHKVLTKRGWIKVELLEENDDIITIEDF